MCTLPLLNLQDAGFQCAEPKLALNRAGFLALREALDEADRTDGDVLVMTLSPSGQRCSLIVQRLPELSETDAEQLLELQQN